MGEILNYYTLYRLIRTRVNSKLICFFVGFDDSISYYNILKTNKKLFVLWSFFITLIKLGNLIQGVQFEAPKHCWQFVLVTAWFQVQLTINLTSGN